MAEISFTEKLILHSLFPDKLNTTPVTPKAEPKHVNSLDSVLNALREDAKKFFHCKIYLYGSRAYGTADGGSDANVFFDIGEYFSLNFSKIR